MKGLRTFIVFTMIFGTPVWAKAKENPINFKSDKGCKAALELLVSMAKQDGAVTAVKEFYESGVIDLEAKSPTPACDDVKFGIAYMGQAFTGTGSELGEGTKRVRSAGKAYGVDVTAVAPKI